LSEQWRAALPDLVCKDSKTFCYVQQPCEYVVEKIQPVGFVMSDYVFEISAEEYLFKARKNTCFFVIHRTDLEGDKDLYMIGDTFL
jgi:hypothetical protein